MAHPQRTDTTFIEMLLGLLVIIETVDVFGAVAGVLMFVIISVLSSGVAPNRLYTTLFGGDGE